MINICIQWDGVSSSLHFFTLKILIMLFHTADWILAPSKCPHPNPWNLWYVTLYGKRDFVDGIRLLTLIQGVQPELCRWVQSNPMGPYSERRRHNGQRSDDREGSGESNHETDFNHCFWLWRKRTGTKCQGMKTAPGGWEKLLAEDLSLGTEDLSYRAKGNWIPSTTERPRNAACSYSQKSKIIH